MSETNDLCVERARRLPQHLRQVDHEIAEHLATVKICIDGSGFRRE